MDLTGQRLDYDADASYSVLNQTSQTNPHMVWVGPMVSDDAEEQKEHLDFCVTMAMRQLNAGRGFALRRPDDEYDQQTPFQQLLASPPTVQIIHAKHYGNHVITNAASVLEQPLAAMDDDRSSSLMQVEPVKSFGQEEAAVDAAMLLCGGQRQPSCQAPRVWVGVTCFPEHAQEGDDTMDPGYYRILDPPEDDDDGPEDATTSEPTMAQQRELLSWHHNMGHPSPEDYAIGLKHAGCRPHLVRWARYKLKCPTCEGRVKPLARRPGMRPRSLRFNMCVGTDTVTFTFMSAELRMLNTVRWGTSLQSVCLLEDATSAAALMALLHDWVKHYGWPEIIITDQRARVSCCFRKWSRGTWSPTPYDGRAESVATRQDRATRRRIQGAAGEGDQRLCHYDASGAVGGHSSGSRSNKHVCESAGLFTASASDWSFVETPGITVVR